MPGFIGSLSIFFHDLTDNRKNEIVFCSFAVLLIGFLTYGYTFFSFTYNNDGIHRIDEVDVSFTSGLIRGRWMYALVSDLYFTAFRLPLFHGLFTVLLLLINTIILWSVFEIRKISERILAGGIFMSMPLFIHYFYFTGDAEVYSTGMVLILLSLVSFSRQTLIAYLVAVVLIVMALGCYPALFSFATVVYLFYVIYAFTKDGEIRQNVMLLLRALGVCLLGLLLYYLFTKGMIAFLGLKILAYRSADQLSIPVLLVKFPLKLLWTFLLHGLYALMASVWYKIFFVLGMIGIFRTMSTERILSMRSLYAVFLICAMLVSALSIYLVTFETWPYPGFQFGVIILASMLVLYGVRLFGGQRKTIAYVLAAVFMLSNIRTDNAIALKYELKRDAGQRLVSHLMHDIISHEGYVKGKTHIAFTGSLVNNSNYDLTDPFPSAKVHNDLQLAPVGFAGSRVEKKIANQMLLQGIDILYLDGKDLERYKTFVIEHPMPDYPEHGSILQEGDTLVVNLGSSPPATSDTKDKFLNIYEGSPFLKKLMSKMR